MMTFAPLVENHDTEKCDRFVLNENFLQPEENMSKEEMLSQLLKMEPTFNSPEETIPSFDYYLQGLQKLVYRVLSRDIKAFGQNISSLAEREKVKEFFLRIHQSIPAIVHSMNTAQFPSIISFATLCDANYTHGVGRFLSDVFSKWLVPGKQLNLVFVHSVAFRFIESPSQNYFIHELFVKIDNKKDLAILQGHLPNVIRETRLNISAVQHARTVMSLKPLSLDQKRLIIQENISSLLSRPAKELDHTIYDQMQHFLLKISAEEKLTRIKEQLTPLLEFKPQIFEREIFLELQKFIFLFKDHFTAIRSSKHLTRIIAYKYLFRKTITGSALSNPHQRHLSIKLLRTTLYSTPEERRVVGVLIGVNTLRDNEILEEKHVMKAIQSILVGVQKVTDSGLTDRRNNDQVRTIYLEIEKKVGAFTMDDITLLRLRLPKEIKTRIESVINPIFMPRNEEEVIRNILILSNQLKYAQDIPQLVITFHKQTESQLSFTIILLRVLKSGDLPLQKLFAKLKAKVKFSEHEIKHVGLVRKRYPKEANIFELQIEKKHFLRKDFSVDLYEARKFIFDILSSMFGEVRDYNGGMISKQNEVLSELKKLLLQLNIHNDFLLENFFYSLNPKYMQSILKPHILKKLFLLLLEVLEHDYNSNMYYIKAQIVDDSFLLSVGVTSPSFKEFIEQRMEHLDFDPTTLTTSYVNIYDISCLSYILKFNDSSEHENFLHLMIESIKVWKETIKKNLPSNSFVLH